MSRACFSGHISPLKSVGVASENCSEGNPGKSSRTTQAALNKLRVEGAKIRGGPRSITHERGGAAGVSLSVGRTGTFLWGTPLHPLLNDREHLLKRARRLEYITIAWNSVEAAVAILSGLLAGSVALVGFGLDSFIEVTSGAALLWRLHRDGSVASRERAEHLSLRIVGSCFLLLAAYVTVDSLDALITGRAPERSLPGMIIAVAALIAMPLLSRAKRRVSVVLGSAALAADARQTDFCAYLSAILLTGLLLNALFGLWWADPAAGLIMVPIIAREGIVGWQGRTCCDDCH